MLSIRVGFVLATFVPYLFCQAQDFKQMSQPPTLPLYDWGACPFEGCSYRRQWTAKKQIVVYNTWKQNRQVVTKLSKGERVFGVTGVFITFKPGVLRVNQDVPGDKLKRGDRILTYAYRGEGFSAVWLKGKFYESYDTSSGIVFTEISEGEKHWWAQVKLRSSKTGWVNMDHQQFDGVDMLAQLNHSVRTLAIASIPVAAVQQGSKEEFRLVWVVKNAFLSGSERLLAF